MAFLKYGQTTAASGADVPTPTVLSCAGVPITACSPADAADTVVGLAISPIERGIDVHLCNAYTLALADREPDFRSMLGTATHNFPDGMSIIWANRLLYPNADVSTERVSGPDFFVNVLKGGRAHGLTHFLLGSTPEVLDKLRSELERQFPGVKVVGVASPPFRALTDRESRDQLQLISSSGAQVVWVGLGTPKQDWEAARLAAAVPAVFCAVGAAFDFLAGNKRRAPLWMRDRGLEWMFRLATEPRRLWRRYVFGNARFLKAVAAHR